jgi:hypothetical protein
VGICNSSSLFSLEFPLSLLIVLCGIDTVLVVIDKVEPRHHVDPNARVTRLTRSGALHVFGELTLAVEFLAALDFVDHFAHVHVEFAAVFGEAVETVCFGGRLLASGFLWEAYVRGSVAVSRGQSECGRGFRGKTH